MKKSLRLKALLTLLVGLFLSIGAFAQQIAVKGHVKDTTGEPVIGANVLVKGTTNGTITDFDGNFMLNVPKDAILSVSFVGYKSAEVKAASTVSSSRYRLRLGEKERYDRFGYGHQTGQTKQRFDYQRTGYDDW